MDFQHPLRADAQTRSVRTGPDGVNYCEPTGIRGSVGEAGPARNASTCTGVHAKQAFMRNKGATILGLQTMAAPVWMTITYAYHMQMSEALAAVRKQPDWVRSRVYTETFRAEGEPTNEQVREMMRTMLTERFGLQTHEFTREGTVNRLVMSKPGVLGPNIKPHPEGASCSTQERASVGKAPDASVPPVAHCGFTYYYLPGMVLHLGLTNTTIADAARSLTGIGVAELATRPMIDATGLTGKYDLTLEFRPDSDSAVLDSGADV